MFKQKKIIVSLFILIPYFISGCQSFSSKMQSIAIDDPVYLVVESLNKRCYDEKKPQFLLDFISDNVLLPFSFEGVWEKQFQTMRSNLVGSLGEVYYSFGLNRNEFYTNKENKFIQENRDFNRVTQMFSAIGSRGLRALFCGSYAFQNENSEYKIYSIPNEKIENILHSDKLFYNYFSRSVMDIKGNDIEVQTQISAQKQGKGFGFVMKSKFFYGPFSQEAAIDLKWQGFVSSDVTIPVKISMIIENKPYEINVKEFK